VGQKMTPISTTSI